MSRDAPVHVLICWERLRGDDGAAVLAASLLPPDVVALARITEVGQISPDAFVAIPPDAPLIVADAAVGIPAGRIVVLALESLADSAGDGATPASSHSLPARQVLALVSEIRGAPVRGTLIVLGGATFEFGERLSAPVAAALPDFTAAIASEIRRLTGDRAPGRSISPTSARRGPLALDCQ